MKYVFRGPTYRPFPYERILAAQELSVLSGYEAAWKGDALILSVPRPLPVELLRRLAFTSSIEAPSGVLPTDAHLLEQSALYLRNGNCGKLQNGERSSRKESSYLTHGLHKYKGKFYPQLCRSLINIAGIEAQDLVLDPFMGSGTTLVECAISGIDSLGFDLNPLAHLVASAKLELLRTPIERLFRSLKRFEMTLAAQCREIGLSWGGYGSPEPAGNGSFLATILAEECGLPEATDEIRRWFPCAVSQKLVAILRSLKRVESAPFRRLVQVCLSDQIRSVSQQDPRDLRIRRRAEEITDAPVLSLLSEKLLKELEKLKAGIAVLGAQVEGIARTELRDARTLERRDHPILSQRRVDAIVTSPPYANALPYIDTDRLSLLVLGLLSTRARNQVQKQIIGNREIQDRDRRALETEMEGTGGLRSFPTGVATQIRRILSENRRHPVGFRRRNVPALLYQYFRDMRTVMAKLHGVVRSGGRAFVVLGDSSTHLGSGEEVTIKTTKHVAELAEQGGWKAVEAWPITVTVEDLAHVRNAITENKILVLERRPERTATKTR
jgi:hypothetical protein